MYSPLVAGVYDWLASPGAPDDDAVEKSDGGKVKGGKLFCPT